MLTLFSTGFIEKAIGRQSFPNFDQKKEWVQKWIESISDRKEKETAIKSSLLSMLMKDILDYTPFGCGEVHNLKEEEAIPGAGSADFVIGFFNGAADIQIAGELKGLNINLDKPQTGRKDLKTPVEQGFNYLQCLPDNAKFLIVSNMNEIRLYKRGVTNKCERFYFIPPKDHPYTDVRSLADDKELKRFIYLLSKYNLIALVGESNTEKLLKNQSDEEKLVERQFYEEYKYLRHYIFHIILQHNPQYKEDKNQLLILIQKLLDRIIFCWFCEDSREQLLPSNILQHLIERETKDEFYDKHGFSIFPKLKGLFDAINVGNPVFKIEKGYNGGLFREDTQLDNLKIPNSIFEDIAKLSRYDFGNDEILNVNILGHIFEQSISDLEEMRAGFENEDFNKQQSKRKKEGVYYTPEYITRYIVDQAVGGWLRERMQEAEQKYANWKPNLQKKEFKGLSDEEIENERRRLIYSEYQTALHDIKILDPACGSGAFLVQAFDYLFQENKRVFNILNEVSFTPELWNDDRFIKSILQNNLYGVDLNTESVEITKLSLWLKTAERNKVLTDLDENIKCGNSLIDDQAIAGDKAFEWKSEFPEVMDNGGFDVVIGNPPYVRQELLGDIKWHFEKGFESFAGTADIFTYFYEKGIKLLNSTGYLSFISNTFSKTAAAVNLRKFLKEKTTFINITDLSNLTIFEGLTTYPMVFTFKNQPPVANSFIYINVGKSKHVLSSTGGIQGSKVNIVQEILRNDNWSFETTSGRELKDKIKSFPTIKELLGKCFRGIVTGFNEAFIISGKERAQLIVKDPNSSNLINPFLEGKDIKKWFAPNIDKWIIFTRRGIEIDKYPAIKEWLTPYKERLTPKSSKDQTVGRKPGKYQWYEIQDSVDYFNLFEVPKITWANLQSSNKFCFDDQGYYINAPSVIFPVDEKIINPLALLSILNSKLAWFFFTDICVIRSGGFIEMKPQYFEQFPLCLPDQSTPLTRCGEKMVEYHKQLSAITTKFLSFIQSEYQPQKLSTKLEGFFELDYATFTKELSKQKVKLSAKQKYELQDIFEGEIKKIGDIQSQIRQVDYEINQHVYALYGLTDEEIRIIEVAVNQ
jgi:type I restriction-modification system DNA methylase subunit